MLTNHQSFSARQPCTSFFKHSAITSKLALIASQARSAQAEADIVAAIIVVTLVVGSIIVVSNIASPMVVATDIVAATSVVEPAQIHNVTARLSLVPTRTSQHTGICCMLCCV